MRGLAAQHAAQRHEAIEALGPGGGHDGARDLERAWDGMALSCGPCPLDRGNGAARQLIAQISIEARLEDEDMRPGLDCRRCGFVTFHNLVSERRAT